MASPCINTPPTHKWWRPAMRSAEGGRVATKRASVQGSATVNFFNCSNNIGWRSKVSGLLYYLTILWALRKIQHLVYNFQCRFPGVRRFLRPTLLKRLTRICVVHAEVWLFLIKTFTRYKNRSSAHFLFHILFRKSQFSCRGDLSLISDKCLATMREKAMRWALPILVTRGCDPSNVKITKYIIDTEERGNGCGCLTLHRHDESSESGRNESIIASSIISENWAYIIYYIYVLFLKFPHCML